MRSSNGNLWVGWAGYCGIPSTLLAFGIAWPIGLLLLAATITAFAIGRHVEQERAVLDDIDRHTEARRAAEARAAEDAEWEDWTEDVPNPKRDF